MNPGGGPAVGLPGTGGGCSSGFPRGRSDEDPANGSPPVTRGLDEARLNGGDQDPAGSLVLLTGLPGVSEPGPFMFGSWAKRTRLTEDPCAKQGFATMHGYYTREKSFGR